MHAQSILLLALGVNAHQSLEVLMEVLVLHLVDDIHHPEIVLHDLERIAQVGADKFVVVEVLHFYAGDDLVELLAYLLLWL